MDPLVERGSKGGKESLVRGKREGLLLGVPATSLEDRDVSFGEDVEVWQGLRGPSKDVQEKRVRRGRNFGPGLQLEDW